MLGRHMLWPAPLLWVSSALYVWRVARMPSFWWPTLMRVLTSPPLVATRMHVDPADDTATDTPIASPTASTCLMAVH